MDVKVTDDKIHKRSPPNVLSLRLLVDCRIEGHRTFTVTTLNALKNAVALDS